LKWKKFFFTAGNKYLRVLTRHDIVYKGLTPISNNITIIKCLGFVDPKAKPFPLVEEVTAATFDINDEPPPILTTFFPRAKDLIDNSLPVVIEEKPTASTAKSKKKQDSPPQPEPMIGNNPEMTDIIDLEKLPIAGKLTAPRMLVSNSRESIVIKSKKPVPIPCTQPNITNEISRGQPILYGITQTSFSDKHFHHNHNTAGDYANFVALNSNMPTMSIINNNIQNVTNFSYPGKYEARAVEGPMVNTVYNDPVNINNFITNQGSQEHQDAQYINEFWDFGPELIGNPF